MDYPVCPHCGDKGPHRLIEAEETAETWLCGSCPESFEIELTNRRVRR